MTHRLLVPALTLLALAGACSPRDGAVTQPSSVGDMCRPAQEAECIGRSGGLAARDGNVLRLRLEGGKVAEFRSEPSACAEGIAQKCVVYRLDGYRPTEDLFVVAETRYEGGDHVVVERKGGSRTVVDNHRPHFSPTGTHFVGVMSSEMHEPDRDLAIWSAGGGEPRLVWSHDRARQGFAVYEFVAWQGEDAVLLQSTCRATNAGPTRIEQAQIVRKDGAWTLVKPDDCP